MAENQNFRVKNGLEIGGELIVAGTTVIDSSGNLVDIGNITTSGYLRGPASFIIDPAAHGDDTGTVIIAGNLQVDGTTTTINSTTITLDDKNIVLASGAANAAAADGAGITIDGAAATLTYANIGDKWTMNKPLDVTGTLLTNNSVKVSGLASSNSTPITDEVELSGYGLIGNRGNLYITNADANGQIVMGISGAHNATPKLTVTTGGISINGNVTLSGTVDGVDIATRDAILTSTTTTANAALPKAGGTMTGTLAMGANAITSTGTISSADITSSGIITTQAASASAGIKIKRTNASTSGARGYIGFMDSDNYFVASIDSRGTGVNNSGDLRFTTSTGGAHGGAYDLTPVLTLGTDNNATFAGIITATGGNSTNWNTSYTYSQVGHLPLAGGTLTGDLVFSGSRAIQSTFFDLDFYTNGTVPLGVGRLELKSGGKTGWAPGDEHGAIEWYVADGSGVGARTAARIVSVNNQGNGVGTTTFEGDLAFYTSAYNAFVNSSPALLLGGDNTATFVNNVNINTGALQLNGTTVIDAARNLTSITSLNTQKIGTDGEGFTGMGFGYYSNNVTRAVGSGVQWYKVAAFSGGVKAITMRVQAGGDNTNAVDTFFLSCSSYGMKANIMKFPSTRYNGSKLMEVRAKFVSNANYEIWVKLDSITTSAGNLFVSMNDSGVISSLSAGTEPTYNSSYDATLVVTVADRNDYAIQTTGKIETNEGYAVNDQVFIDASRNLTNIGTLNSGTPWTSANDGSGSTLDADLLDGQQGSYYAPNSSLGNYLPLTGGTLTGTLTANAGIALGNTDITGVNALSFNDPGPNEGIAWSGGNTKIYESPDDLATNTAGNLQFVYGSTRRLTVNSTGIDVTGTATMDGLTVEGSSAVIASFARDGSDGDAIQIFNGGVGTTKVLGLGGVGNNGIITNQYGNIQLAPSGTTIATISATGIDVTGAITADGLTSAGTILATSSTTISMILRGGDGNSKNLVFQKTTGSVQQAKISAVGDDLRFTTGPTDERMRITSSGDIGIGTSAPTSKLDIRSPNGVTHSRGQLYLTNTDTAAINQGSQISLGGTYSGTSDTYFASIAGRKENATVADYAGYLQFATRASGGSNIERMRITSAGDVGIGTSSPASALSGSNVNLTMEDADGADIRFKRTSGVDFTVGVTSSNTAYVWNGGGHHMLFGTASTERMRIQSTGNVSIGGNTAPSYKLVVSNGNAAGIEFGPEYATDTNLVQHYDRTASAYMDVNNIAQNHRFGRASNEWMRITSTGNVGIGTSSPSAKLTVALPSGTNGDIISMVRWGGAYSFNLGLDANSTWYVANASDEKILNVTYTGNVGIGTSSPDAWLQIEKDNNNSGNQFSVADTEGASAAIRTYTHNGDPAGLILNHYYAQAGSGYEYMRYADIVANVGNGAGTTMRFITKNAANTFSTTVIDNNGKVGIGTSSPNQKLHVQNSSGTTLVRTEVASNSLVGFNIKKTGPTTQEWNIVDGATVNGRLQIQDVTDNRVDMTFDGTGNVGIGTTSPNKTLEVANAAGGATVSISTDQIPGSAAAKKYVTLDFTGYNNNQMAQIQSWDESSSTGYGFLTFSTRQNNSSLVEAMRINQLGYVGIGTTAPERALHVVGGIHMPNANVLSWDAADGTLRNTMYVDSGDDLIIGDTNFDDIYFSTGQKTKTVVIKQTTGNVGIGTTSPAAKLDITGNNSDIAFTFGNTVPNNPLHSNYYGGYSGIGMDQTTAGVRIAGNTGATATSLDIGYYTSGVVSHANWNSSVMVKNDSKVGIGNISPQKKLTIGSSQGEGIQFTYDGTNNYRSQILTYWTSSIDSRMDFNIARSSGVTPATIMSVGYGENVGIGTTTPSELLEVKKTTANAIIKVQTGGGHDARLILDAPAADGAQSQIFFDASGTTAGSIQYTHNSGGTNYMTFGTGGSNTERMRIHSAGGLSIGTTAAANAGGLLVDNDIKGNSRIGVGSGGNTTDAAIYKISDTNTGIIWPAADTLAFTTAGAERLRIASSGGLITNPDAGGHAVFNEGGIDADFRVESSGNANMLFVDGGSNRVIVGAAGGLTSTFNVSGNAQFSNGTGNVGSLSIAPSNDRQLITANSPGNYGDYGVTLKSMRATGGSAYINNIDMTYQGTVLNEEGLDLDFRVESNTNTHALFVEGSGNNVGIGTSTLTSSSGYHTLSLNGSTGGQLSFQTGGSGKHYIFSTATDLNMYNSVNGALRFYTNNLERLEMTSSSTIFNDIGADVDFRVQSDTKTHALFVQGSDGNVGIGTSSPDRELEVEGNSASTTITTGIKVKNANVGTNSIAGIVFENYDNNSAWIRSPRSGSSVGTLTFGTNSGTGVAESNINERMRIDSSGNVGIGTTAPSAKLEISGFSTGAGLKLNYGNSSGTIEAVNFKANGGANGVIGMQMVSAGVGDLWLGGSGGRSLTLYRDGNVGIGTTTPGYKLEVNGSFAATTKSFVIDHPTKEGMKLRYGSLEGPENGVYVRGRLKDSNVIELPDYWTGLVHEDSITVSLTAIGKSQELYVIDINDNKVTVSGNDSINCFYTIFAERKDVEKLEVEYK